MGAYNNPETKIAGFKQSLKSDDKTLKVSEINGIPYGYPVFKYAGGDLPTYQYHDNVATVTLAGDLIALNSVALSVNGTSITPVVFAATHNATMTLLAAQIEADIAGSTVVLLDTGGTNRDFTITINDGVDRVVVLTVTLGGGQTTATYAYTSSMIFQGFSRFEQAGAAAITDIDGTVIRAASNLYALNAAMSTMISGDITVVTDSAITGTSQVYVVKDGADQGKCTDTVGVNILLAGATFTETTTTARLANVRINK